MTNSLLISGLREQGVMNIELAPDVQLRMKHPVSGLNEIALAPLNKEKESPFYRQSLPVPVAPN